MNKEQYSEQRKALLDEAEVMIGEGKTEEANAKMKEIEELDNKWEETKLANANMEALKGKTTATDLTDKSIDLNGGKLVDSTAKKDGNVNMVDYKNAFLKNLLGVELTESEKTAYVHTTVNTDAVIPEELQNKIYSNMEESHPLLKDVQVLRTGAVITIAKHTAIVAGDAKQVAEGEANADEENTFVNVSLSGKDFSKHIDFSYRLGKMAIPAFEQYLITEIASRLGAAMTADIVAQIKSDLATANKIDAETPGTLALGDVLNGLGSLKQTGRVYVYANNTTFYGNIAKLEGAEGLLSFIPNYQEAISGQLLGKGIKQEDALADGEILILDPQQFIYNMVQDIMLERDKDIKKHVHTISGFAIAEGTMTNDKAGALITVGTGV